MYIPKHFAVSDKDEIFAFIKTNAFGQLISTVDGKLFSTHIPFLVSDDKTKIYGHLARQNPQHTEIDKQEILITIEGTHDYISPSWYSRPGVPTWNYQAVHIYGHCSVITATEELQTIVNTLTANNEAAFETPWQPDYQPSMLNAIVGVEVAITDIQCQFKLSQNRSLEDRTKVIEQLKAKGAIKLANAMERNES